MNRGTHTSGDGSFSRDAGTQTAKAVALVVVAVLIGWALLRHAGTTKVALTTATSTAPVKKEKGASSPTSSTTLPTTTTTIALVPPGTVKLQVLNGVLTGQLATYYSNKLRSSPGYDTLSPDNATSRVTASVIYVITPNYGPEAEALAATLRLAPAVVQTTVPAGAPITAAAKAAANLVLVIGPDLAAQVKG